MNKKHRCKILLLCIMVIHAMLLEITIGNNNITYAAEVGLFSFEGGDGTENNPYKISTAKQLDAIRNDLDACYELVNDINLSTLNSGKWVPIGTEDAPFIGKLDGNGFAIRNIKSIESPIREVYAMFNYVSDAEFKNLKIVNDDEIKIYCGRTGYEYTKIAVFIGCGTADIIGCSVKADLTGMGYGAEIGLLTANVGGTIKECYTEGRIKGYIAGTYPKYVFVGGIAGVTSAYIENCYSNALVEVSAGSGASEPGVRVGGIVGQYSGGDNSIKNTYFTGTIQQLSRPSVNKDVKGGIVGLWDSGKIEDSYYDNEKANLEKEDEYARTTDEMKQFATYQDWDFDNVWCRNYFNDGYPFLRNNLIDSIWNEYGNIIEFSEEYSITLEELFTKYPSYIGNCYIEELMGHIYENTGKIGTHDSLIDLIIPAWRKNLETGNYIVKSSMKLLFPAINEKEYKDLVDVATLKFLETATQNDYFMLDVLNDVKNKNASVKEFIELMNNAEQYSDEIMYAKIRESKLFTDEEMDSLLSSLKKNEENENLGKIFSRTAEGLDICKILLTIGVMKAIDEQMIVELRTYAREGSDLDKGLERLQERQRESYAEGLIEEYLENKFYDGLDKPLDKVFELYFSPDANWAIMVGKIVLEKSAFLLTDIELDDVASASIYAGMYRDLEGSTNQQIVQLIRDVNAGEVVDVEKEIGRFQLLFEARKAALQCMLEVTEKIAKDTQKDMIRYYRESYMTMLDYPEYLSKSCEAASYEQKFNYGYIDGNATIKSTKTAEQVNILSVSVMENITLEKVVFPEKIGEYRISEIEDGAFEGDETIEAIIIPGGIERIGDRAFAGMLNLKSVIIKEGVKEIGNEAFVECPQLEVITLPESLNNIGQGAFDSGVMVNSPQNTIINEYVQNNGLLHNQKVPVVDSIVIARLPDKLNYSTDEEIDETGMEILVNYANGKEEIKYDGWLSYFEEKTVGENKIFVIYQGAETEYLVNVDIGETDYTVSYKDIDDNVIADRIEKKGTVGQIIKESALEIAGYEAIESEKEYELQIEGNEIIFYYQDITENLSDSEVLYENTYYYTGKEIEPIVEVRLDGEKLTEKENYNVYSFNNVELGKGQFLIVGKGRYSGFLHREFEIVEKQGFNGSISEGETGGNDFGVIGDDAIINDNSKEEEGNKPDRELAVPNIERITNKTKAILVEWNRVENTEGYYIYRKTGSKGKWEQVKEIKKSDVTSWKDKSVKNGKKYKYKICAYNAETISSDSDVIIVYYLSKPSIKEINRITENTAILSYSVNKKVKGYQIEYSTSKEFNKTSTKMVRIKNNQKSSKKLYGLESEKTYYIRIRSYKIVNGKKYYSAWSNETLKYNKNLS